MTPGAAYSRKGAPSNPDEATRMKRVPYREAIGSLMYASVATRPNITFAVSTLSQFLDNPGEAHWEAVKRVFRYLAGTKHFAATATLPGVQRAITATPGAAVVATAPAAVAAVAVARCPASPTPATAMTATAPRSSSQHTASTPSPPLSSHMPVQCCQSGEAPHHFPCYPAWGHNDTAASNCSCGGSLPQPRPPTMRCCRHHHLSAPVLEGACNCRSSQMQELLVNTMMGVGGSTHPYLCWPVACNPCVAVAIMPLLPNARLVG